LNRLLRLKRPAIWEQEKSSVNLFGGPTFHLGKG